MILLEFCAVRIAIIFISLLTGLSSPPVVFDQANQNISCGFSDTELSDLAMSHTLSGYSSLLQQVSVELDSIFYLQGNFTIPFTLEPELLRQVYDYDYHLQQSLSHWAEWTATNLFTIALICASMVCVSLVSTILYLIWTHINRNKILTRKIRNANATLSYMESVHSVSSCEYNKLKETRKLLEEELLKLTTQSENSKQLVAQAQEKLALAKEELENEKLNEITEQRQLESDHTKILSGMNEKLGETQRQASLFQKLESEATTKSASLRKLLEKERKDYAEKQLLLSDVVRELQQELQETKEVQRKYAMLELEGHKVDLLRERSDEVCWDAVSRVAREQSLISVQVIERKLRQTTSEIVKLNTRFSYSMINECGCDQW